MAVDEIVRRHSFSPWRSRFQADCAEGHLGGEKVLVLKPQTYMNESGRAVGEALRFYKLAPEDVIVIYDEIDLAPGKIRVKQGGGTGGHNGIRSLEAHIGKEFWRVRLGVGHPGEKDLVHGHVLSDFAKADRVWLDRLLDAVATEIPALVEGDAPRFMSRVAEIVTPPRPKPPRKPPESAEGGTGPSPQAPAAAPPSVKSDD
jgi:PTH1 family peptidyl-tRNA hydrolase